MLPVHNEAQHIKIMHWWRIQLVKFTLVLQIKILRFKTTLNNLVNHGALITFKMKIIHFKSEHNNVEFYDY